MAIKFEDNVVKPLDTLANLVKWSDKLLSDLSHLADYFNTRCLCNNNIYSIHWKNNRRSIYIFLSEDGIFDVCRQYDQRPCQPVLTNLDITSYDKKFLCNTIKDILFKEPRYKRSK